jgi:hypothetical protein
LLALTVLTGTMISAFGYMRRERREDWRGVTGYLMKIGTRQRLVVVDRDLAQVVVRYYSTGLFRSYPPVEITGMETKFDPGAGFELLSAMKNTRTADPTAALSQALDSGRCKEIDLALQPDAPWSKEITNYLDVHCASLEAVKFHSLQVRRCLVQSRKRQTALTPTVWKK